MTQTDNTQTLINALARIEKLEAENRELFDKLSNFAMETLDLSAKNARLTERAKIARREALEGAARLLETKTMTIEISGRKNTWGENEIIVDKSGTMTDSDAIRALMERET